MSNPHMEKLNAAFNAVFERQPEKNVGSAETPSANSTGPVPANTKPTREEVLGALLVEIANTKMANELAPDVDDDASEQLDAIILKTRELMGINPYPKYGYYVNLNERGYFEADVRSELGTSVFEVKSGLSLPDGESSLMEDGFMNHAHDIGGLCTYLREMKIIESNAIILKSRDFEKAASCSRALETVPKLITESDWEKSIGCMPPVRWHRHEKIEFFHLSELYDGDIATFFAKVDSRHLTFRANKDMSSDMLVNKVRQYLNLATPA